MPPYATELASELHEKLEWMYEFIIPSKGVPLTDGLVLIVRREDGHIAARNEKQLQRIAHGDAHTAPALIALGTATMSHADTAVTNNGYREPNFYRYPAVLQAGTAVFVSSYGEPKVKCFSGNPLQRGRSFSSPKVVHSVRFVGRPWPKFETRTVSVIKPTTTAIRPTVSETRAP